MRSTLLVLVAASFTLYSARPADACSPPPCWPGAFVPGNHGRVPANVPGLFWRPMSSYELVPDPANVVLASAADPTTPIAFTAQPLGGDFLLVPEVALPPGDYVLTDHTKCERFDMLGPQAAFTVGPAAPLPAGLGDLVAMPSGLRQMSLATSFGSCSSPSTVDDVVLELAPSADAAPWLDVLLFETWVDGKRWEYRENIVDVTPPGASPLGRARDRVFQVCSTMDASVSGLAAGKHVVTMRAALPGSSQTAASGSLEVTLQCDRTVDDPPVETPAAGGGCSAGPGAGAWLGLALLALVRGRRARGTRRCV